jgi:23S rRNA pseudouridine955/2504/2580 synthase/23S rRNA pseudouridine1911/1915/1917 synthase
MEPTAKDSRKHLPYRRLEIIFENNEFVVVNKSAGQLSVPDRTQSETSLKDLLIEKYGNIFTVHRLDKETSGIIIFAKNEGTHKYLSGLFEGRLVEKHYVALVHGTLQNKNGTIDAPIMEHPVHKGQMMINRSGKASSTGYEVLEELGKYSFVKFQLHTGRTHQIRIHAKHIGHPVVCDPLYGDGLPVLLSSIKKKYKLNRLEEEERPMLNRVALHAQQLLFKDAAGNDFDLVAELPKDMRALMQQLKKNR